jgi:hypothetical protein
MIEWMRKESDLKKTGKNGRWIESSFTLHRKERNGRMKGIQRE